MKWLGGQNVDIAADLLDPDASIRLSRRVKLPCGMRLHALERCCQPQLVSPYRTRGCNVNPTQRVALLPHGLSLFFGTRGVNSVVSQINGAKLLRMDELSLTPEPFDLGATEAEWMCFDDHREWFVDVSRTPIVFTVRGIAFFSPQFRRFGLSISDVTTAEQFADASMQASLLQMQDCSIRLNQQAHRTHGASEYKVLDAAINGSPGDLDRELKRLQHKRTSGLQIVGGVATSAVHF